MKALSQVTICALVLLSTYSCVAKPVERRISGEDTTWIVRGETTRDEVVSRFGPADSSLEVQFDGHEGDYAEYAPDLASDIYEGAGYASPFQPRPRGGGAEQLGGAQPQVFRPPLESLRGPAREGPVFWVLYDNDGVVRDFGFEGAGAVLQSSE